MSRKVVLQGQNHVRFEQYDQGPAEPSFQIRYATLILKPTAAQQRDLDALLADQQDRSSAGYHRWLSPEQFADRFGATNADIAVLSGWLSSQGLKVHDTARGRHWLTFSGSSADIQRAFQTEIHRYRIAGRDRFDAAADISIPAAFESIVAGISGLNDFDMLRKPLDLKPAFTDRQGNHQLTPGDLTTIYNVNPLYATGIDGTGQKVAIVGETDIFVDDIEQFQTIFHLPIRDPQVITFGPDPGFNFDALFEADLDLQWSGAMAPQATIVYVEAFNAFLAAQYAIDQKVAPVLSMSFGTCEPSSTAALRYIGQQASAQGITWMASSGDSGAAGCEIQDAFSVAGKGLAVAIPASFPEVTAVGGTEFNEGTGTYWAPINGVNHDSALSYIPEIAWNDTAFGSPLGSTGGGVSIFFDKPLWQTGPGVPSDKFRDVPDISLSASGDHDPYVVAFAGGFFLVGGTSASSPAFAGMVALLNQYLESNKTEPKGGLGNVNPTLYRLAQTNPSAFHDVTGGSNVVPCVQATPNCLSGSLGYHAGKGYDPVTGLGSIDLNKLVTGWKVGSPSTTSLHASPGTITVNGGAVQLVATVKVSGGTPTGTVSFIWSEDTFGTAPLVVSGSNATATLSVDAGQFVPGTHPVTAVYSGDKTFEGSAGSTNVTITVPQSAAAVAPFVSPNPVLEGPLDSNGNRWRVTLFLSEEAGIAATVTGLSINGVSYDSQLSTIFKSTVIPPHQTIAGVLGFATLPSPATQTFVFTGTDVNGNTWTAKASTQFIAALRNQPSLVLTSTPGAISQESSNTSCPWKQQLTIQNQGGYFVFLDSLTMDSLDLSSRIQQIFGTTQMGPFGSLQGVYCRTDVKGTETRIFNLIGFTERGQGMLATTTVTFQSAAASPASMSVSPSTVTAPGTLSLNFSGGSPDWTVSILPGIQTTSWLTVSALSGTGPAELTLSAKPSGLGKGVYNATLVIQAVNATPQYINVPVTLLVGDTSKIKIGGVTNSASSKQAFAPGMLMSVYGTALAPDGTSRLASTIPLPLNLSGVSATVNGQPAPMDFASPGQINIQVPYETSGGTAILGVNNNGQVAAFPFEVAFAAPGIFTGTGGALNPTSTGKPGDILLAFITGAGDVSPSIPTGQSPPAGTRTADLPTPLSPVSVTVGGLPASVKFAGVAPGLVGVVQINFAIPADVPAGTQDVIVKVGGIAAPTANITVTAATPSP